MNWWELMEPDEEAGNTEAIYTSTESEDERSYERK